jgi:hypothetical protein
VSSADDMAREPGAEMNRARKALLATPGLHPEWPGVLQLNSDPIQTTFMLVAVVNDMQNRVAELEAQMAAVRNALGDET